LPSRWERTLEKKGYPFPQKRGEKRILWGGRGQTWKSEKTSRELRIPKWEKKLRGGRGGGGGGGHVPCGKGRKREQTEKKKIPPSIPKNKGKDGLMEKSQEFFGRGKKTIRYRTEIEISNPIVGGRKEGTGLQGGGCAR